MIPLARQRPRLSPRKRYALAFLECADGLNACGNLAFPVVKLALGRYEAIACRRPELRLVVGAVLFAVFGAHAIWKPLARDVVTPAIPA